MSRAVVGLDRFAAFVVGVVLVGVGALAVLWWVRPFGWMPDSLDTSPLTDTTSSSWWPWVCGAVALVLLVVGLRWLLAHLPTRRVSDLTLPGSRGDGKLRAAAGPVAKAAADVLAATPGVRSAGGRVLHERGQLVARLNATVEAQADLAVIAEAADSVAAQVARVLERDDLHCQVQLKVAARSRPMPRVS